MDENPQIFTKIYLQQKIKSGVLGVFIFSAGTEQQGRGRLFRLSLVASYNMITIFGFPALPLPLPFIQELCLSLYHAGNRQAILTKLWFIESCSLAVYSCWFSYQMLNISS